MWSWFLFFWFVCEADVRPLLKNLCGEKKYGARLCEPQQRPLCNTLQFISCASWLATLLRLTEPRSVFPCPGSTPAPGCRGTRPAFRSCARHWHERLKHPGTPVFSARRGKRHAGRVCSPGIVCHAFSLSVLSVFIGRPSFGWLKFSSHSFSYFMF